MQHGNRKAGPEKVKASSRQHPCAICGRTKDQDCRQLTESDRWLCHGNTGLRVGEVLLGQDGRSWAFTGVAADQRCGVFKVHEPLPELPAPIQPIAPPSEPLWYYSPTQRIRRVEGENGKSFMPEHISGSRWVHKAGPDPWPFYGSPLQGQAVVEVEGEKCVDVLRAIGINAITHPGHNHTEADCTRRYSDIKAIVTSIIYIADNDETGRSKGLKLQKCAAAAGVPFTLLHAEHLFAGIPEGGSVDDVADPTTIRQAITEGLSRRPPAAAATDAPAADAFRRDVKHHLDAGNPNTGVDFKVFVTDKAILHGLNKGQADDIVKELAKDDDITLEANTGIEKVEADIAAWEYRKANLTLELLLPKVLHAPIRFCMEGLPGCDELAAMLAYMGCVSGVLKTGTLIRANYRSFAVPPSLYIAFIGKSGLGKSPTIREIGMRSLDSVQRNYNKINTDRWNQWTNENAGLKKTDPNYKPKPAPVVMTMHDYTGEFLNTLLSEHEPLQLGHLISCDELSSVFKSLNAYKSAGKGSEEGQLLSLFDGRGGTVGRISTGVTHFDYAQFSIIGGLQPRVFDELAAAGDPGGMYARMLLVKCDETNVYRDPVEAPETLVWYKSQLQIMQDIALRASVLPPQQYRLSDQAMQYVAQLAYDARESGRRTDLDEQSSIHGKKVSQILRLAGISHILAIVAGEVEPLSTIPLLTVRNAADIVEHLHAYALDTQARLHDSGVDTWLVESILRNTEDKKLTAAQYHSRHLTRSKKPLISTAAIEKVMRQLTRRNLGRMIPSSSHGKKGGDAFTSAPDLRHATI